MEQVNREAVRREHSRLQAALTRWGENPGKEAFVLHGVIREARATLAAWDEQGVYPSQEVRQLRDLSVCAAELLTLAQQQQTRGY